MAKIDKKKEKDTRELLKKATYTSGYFKKEGLNDLSNVVNYAAEKLRIKPIQ